jgi:hypothetical protein
VVKQGVSSLAKHALHLDASLKKRMNVAQIDANNTPECNA